MHSTWEWPHVLAVFDLPASVGKNDAVYVLVRHWLIQFGWVVVFCRAIAMAGLPPFSGFIGKFSLLQSATGMQAVLLWVVLLVASFMVIVALSRAGSQLFWKQARATNEFVEALQPMRYFSALALIGSAVILLVAAKPVMNYCMAAAQQLLEPNLYLQLLGEY